MFFCKSKRLICAILILCLTFSIMNAALASTDTTPPEISNISIDKQGQTLGPGDTFTLQYNLTDDSGIADFYAEFGLEGASSRTLVDNLLSEQTYDAVTGFYKIQITVPQNIVNGKWYLKSLDVHDEYFNSNYTEYISSQYYFTVAGGSDDRKPPEISDISIKEQGQVMKPGGSFTLQFKVSDESLLRHIDAQFRNSQQNTGIYDPKNPTSSAILFPKPYFDAATDEFLRCKYNADTGFYEMLFEIPQDTINGEWYLSYISAEDVFGNRKELPFGNLNLMAPRITVAGGSDDITPPKISEVILEGDARSFRVGDSFTMKLKIEDESALRNVNAQFQHENYNKGVQQAFVAKSYYDTANRAYLNAQYNIDSGFYEMHFEIPSDTILGNWYLEKHYAHDAVGNGISVRFDETDSPFKIEITEATQTYVDGVIGKSGDRQITGLEAGKKYQIKSNDQQYFDVWYQINADGTVGMPIPDSTADNTTYAKIPILTRTSITGLTNGTHYTVMEVLETAKPADDEVQIPGLPPEAKYAVYELSPVDSKYDYLTTQKSAEETPIGAYDIEVAAKIPEEGVLVSFHVGTQHSGKKLNVLHLHGGKVIRYDGIVDPNGVLTIRVFGFSPFLIMEAVPTPEPSYIPDYNDDPLPVTVYNNLMNSRATVGLSGVGLSSSDLLITKSEPKGAVYDELRGVAGGYEVVGTYDISLKSGKTSSGAPMHLSFTRDAADAGQAFTLVHRKADGTYEYFYATADAKGNLSFGPIHELSPFMLVKGTLEKAVLPEVPDVTIDQIPKTGDVPQTAALAGMLLIGLLGLGAVYIAKRKRV